MASKLHNALKQQMKEAEADLRTAEIKGDTEGINHAKRRIANTNKGLEVYYVYGDRS